MSEIFFFFASHDPSIALEAARLGYSLVVNKNYDADEPLIVLRDGLSDDTYSCQRFYILPDQSFTSKISILPGIKEKSNNHYFYIQDRIGAAAIDLILYKKPSEKEICVGSLGFHHKTYRSVEGPLEPPPQCFSDAFQTLRSYIKRSARPVSNGKTPKTVFVFPRAMALLREDFSRSPWPSLETTCFGPHDRAR